MNEQYLKKSGQIPPFGNWDYANELPITQYFECARQAVAGGLLRYSNSSSGECHPYIVRSGGGGGGGGGCGGDHLHAIDLRKPTIRATSLPPKKTRASSNKMCPQVKQQKKQVKKVCDVAEKPRQPHTSQKVQLSKHSTTTKTTTTTTSANHNRRQSAATIVKAVDEDLYKIPPELLHKTKRKKRLGLFSRCLVPNCMV